ncbi:MAG: hypothetical protein H0U53_07445 [Actinobacteria bacterium]|nr:hypothetical protein [Actinomycetota bacterium]
MSRPRLMVLTVAALVASVLSESPSMAAPTVIDGDRSDNLVTFTYDSNTGQKTSDSTWTRKGGNDDVLFRVAIIETEDSGSGLLGKLTLRLEADQAVRYDGWFALRVVDDSGDVTFYRSRPSEITLRPRPGLRRAAMRFRFDVPSGTHTASGSFEA